MDEKNEFAYPCEFDVTYNSGKDSHPGMTLLDYFAAKAIQAIIETDPELEATIKRSGKRREELISENAYLYANAMLKERQKYL